MSSLALPSPRQTREDRVLELLRNRGRHGACVADVPLDTGYTLRNAVAILRQRGQPIAVSRCTVHEHAHRMVRYTLLPPPEQITLWPSHEEST